MNIRKYYFSCSNCQFIELKLFINEVLFITCMKLMNMWDLNYIDSINFILQLENKYILLKIDYFIRFLISKTFVNVNIDISWSFLALSVYDSFRWSKTLYIDNESYFCDEEFSKRIKKVKIKHIIASITALWNVDLIEKMI